MPYNYELIPLRSDLDGKPSYWLAGHNPNTMRFTFIPAVITQLDAVWTGNVLAILVAGAPTFYSVGDVVYLSNGTITIYGVVSLILDFGGTFSLQVTFASVFSIPAAIIYHGVRAGSYVKFDFLDTITSLVFASVKRTPQQNGIVDIDLSGSVRGQYSLGDGGFNYDVRNFRNDDAQKHFFLRYTEYPMAVATTLSETYHIAKGGFEQRKNNFNSSNFVNFLPNSTIEPGKWLHPLANAGLPVPIWGGYPWAINFIYPDDIAGLNASTPLGAIVFDASQNNGVNYLTIDEADFDGTTEFCFEVGGQPYPSIFKEISGNFRIGGLFEFTYQIPEPLNAVNFTGLLGTSLAGTLFYYGNSIPSLTLYPYAIWRGLVASAIAGDYIKLENNQGIADAPFILSWGVVAILPSFNQLLPFDVARIGLDITLPFRYNVSLGATISGCYADIRTAAPTVQNWTQFTFDISGAGGLASLNAAIAAIIEPSDYAIHIWSDSHILKSVPITYLTAQRERIIHLEEDTNYRYRLANNTLSLGLSGVGQYVYHPSGMTVAEYDNGNSFTIFAAFYFEPLNNPGFIYSTTTWKGGVIKGLRFEIYNNGRIGIGWQTAGGAVIDFRIALEACVINGYNQVVIEFTGTISTVKMWVNKRLITSQTTLNNNAPGWSIVRAFDDAETGDYASQAGGGSWLKGKLNKMQLINRIISDSEREFIFNYGSAYPTVLDSDFVLDFDYTVTPIANRSGTPAIISTEFGAPTKPIYLP